MSYAQRSGSQRLNAANFVCWSMPDKRARGSTEMSHAAPLSLEMSYAQDRVLVNCGPNLVHGEKWHLASRGVAAHSAFGFDAESDPFLRAVWRRRY